MDNHPNKAETHGNSLSTSELITMSHDLINQLNALWPLLPDCREKTIAVARLTECAVWLDRINNPSEDLHNCPST
jgi:hypothetical protein